MEEWSWRPIGMMIVIPAVISLAVTVVRVVGELSRWSPTFLSREAGGGAAIVGIVWLVPVFGIYFAIQLAKTGLGPESRSRAIGYATVAVAAFYALRTVVHAFKLPILASLALLKLVSVLGAAIAYRGWPALARTEILNGLAARVPVAVIMLVAMLGHSGSHYELGPPNFPPMPVLATSAWIGLLRQLVSWIGFTVLVGMLFGSLALLGPRIRS